VITAALLYLLQVFVVLVIYNTHVSARSDSIIIVGDREFRATPLIQHVNKLFGSIYRNRFGGGVLHIDYHEQIGVKGHTQAICPFKSDQSFETAAREVFSEL
jgi:hypothetical protein